MGAAVHPILASIVNSFDSLAVPFFFIVAGYFFFNRIEKLENEAQKKEYAISYLLKTLKIYFVWSVVLLPSRLILSKSSMLGVLLKWFRTVFFIGDAQLWYLNALLIGLILILILKKSKINDTWIMLIGVVFFIAGIFVQKQLDVASVNGYAGFWKLYYMIWGKTIKNGVFMGMFYCMLGTLIQKIPQTKTVFICTISAFILYVVGVYEYYGAAEPPVRCGESHLSGLTEPPHFFIKLLCHCWVQSIYFSHREVFSWVNTFNIDLIGIIRYAIHDGIGKSTFTITDLLVPLTFTELRTKDC